MSQLLNEFHKFEHRGWQGVADRYDNTWSGLTRMFIKPLLDAAHVQSNMQFLDLACGPGYVAEAARRRGAFVTGVDFASEMIRVASGRLPDIEFQEGDAHQLNFDDQSFDAVAMNFGLLHMAHPHTVFHEVCRVLRPDCRFAFSIWAKPEMSPAMAAIDDAIKSHADMNVPIPEGPDYFIYGDKDACCTDLVDTGFNRSSFTFQTLIRDWRIKSPEFFLEAEFNGGVRTAALLNAQTTKVQAAIKQQMLKVLEQFKSRKDYILPYAAHVISVSK